MYSTLQIVTLLCKKPKNPLLELLDGKNLVLQIRLRWRLLFVELIKESLLIIISTLTYCKKLDIDSVIQFLISATRTKLRLNKCLRN